jgi:hypothetical protein
MTTVTDAEIELLPCPFCGADAAFYLSEPMQISCKHGHMFAGQFGYIGSREHLVAAWNTRTDREAAEARARLEGAEIMREALLEKIVNDPEYEGYDFSPGLDRAETHIRSFDPAAIEAGEHLE